MTSDMFPFRRFDLVPTGLFLLAFTAGAQMKTGTSMKDWHAELGLAPDGAPGGPAFSAVLLESNAPANIFWPGEVPKFRFQIQNALAAPLKAEGHVEILEWATEGLPGDVWLPQVRRRSLLARIPLAVDLPASAAGVPGWSDHEIAFTLPERNLGWIAIVDLGAHGRRMLTHGVRTFAQEPRRVRHPHQSMEEMPPEVLRRLGIRAMRIGVPFVSSDQRGSERARELADIEEDLQALHAHGVTVLAEFGEGGSPQPLGRPRPHLDDDRVMRSGKMDHVWLPELDGEFKAEVKRLAVEFGWPKGPITGVMLWNEPWEGSSISGWQADLPRYRELYKLMADAVHEAESEAGVQVLVGGCDSSSNTWDKLFPDGSDEFMEAFDFCSIHYQGLHSPAHFKLWRERTQREGRVLVFDTESWVANTDDRYAGVVAANRAAGYDRAMGVFGGNVVDVLSHRRKREVDVWTAAGRERRETPLQAYPLAAAVGAVQHFIGDRPFREVLYERGLPWVFVFDGYEGTEGDGTVVVLGDLEALFPGGTALYARTAGASDARRRLDGLGELRDPALAGGRRAEILRALSRREPYRDARLVLRADPAGRFALYDFTGNPCPPTPEGNVSVPLDHRGFFLRATDGRADSFEALLAALRTARVEGLEPVQVVARDFLRPVDDGAFLRLNLVSHRNETLSGTLAVEVEGLDIRVPERIEISPRQELELRLPVSGPPRADNTYPLVAVFDAGPHGVAVHYEPLHVNVVSRRTVTVDGALEDWSGTLPQTVVSDEAATRTLAEAAWLPFETFEPGGSGGFATAWLAYDEAFFYAAFRIADATPEPGTLRFSERDDDAFFYPEVSFEAKDGPRVEHRWPEGVRRFSYRCRPVLPAGCRSPDFDNVQIAFNVLPPEEKGLSASVVRLPGRPAGFIPGSCTDHEYALNHVAPEHGGGFEVWRLTHPTLPRKHFYPRQPKAPNEGAVEGARMVTAYREGFRITEAAIPWTEMPAVKAAVDAGRTVKFSYRVNHGGGGPTLELARQRSVSRTSSLAFHVDWAEHWANELEFAFE